MIDADPLVCSSVLVFFEKKLALLVSSAHHGPRVQLSSTQCPPRARESQQASRSRRATDRGPRRSRLRVLRPIGRAERRTPPARSPDPAQRWRRRRTDQSRARVPIVQLSASGAAAGGVVPLDRGVSSPRASPGWAAAARAREGRVSEGRASARCVAPLEDGAICGELAVERREIAVDGELISCRLCAEHLREYDAETATRGDPT